MTSLASLRQTRQLTPERFLWAQPGCWIQYYDDTPAKDPAKALSTRSFNPSVARRKQENRCAVCFSLQAFGEARTKEQLLCFRNLGVDVDLVSPPEKRELSPAEIDRRKDEYLCRHLLPFPLKPHWLIETAHGFHAVFRIMPCLEEESINEAESLNRQLVTCLRGDPNVVLLTQVLRVPGTIQFKNPELPFLCRLLLNQASEIRPYELVAVRETLYEWEASNAGTRETGTERAPHDGSAAQRSGRLPEGLNGVPEGQRNATAAAIVGGIIRRLPESFWETAGWGGLREWNQRNAVPLPERELRSVYESIARRESLRRARNSPASPSSGRSC